MKTKIEDLALFGGPALFSEKLHVGRPNIGNRATLFDRLNDMLDRRWLTNSGTYVSEFEAVLAELIGVKHCISMCNGTVALEIAIRALGLKGEVIIPSMTFVATAHSLQWQEITPVFCDIDPVSFNIDPSLIESHITPKTTGIIGVHLWGRPCDVNLLESIASKNGLKLLFDAAHALGCSTETGMVGTFGDAEVFSFHATKFINSFEGGAVATNNDELANRIRLMKNFGFEGYDNVIYIGTNGKMSEVSAAMGLTSLESMHEFVSINYKNYKSYQNEIAGIDGLELMLYNENAQCNFQYIIIKIDNSISSLSRDMLLKILQEENIMARRYFYPGCHRMEPYKSYQPNAYLLLKNTEDLASKVIVLPTGTSVGSNEIGRIGQLIRFALENGEKIRKKSASAN